jgi:hypothetical protein
MSNIADWATELYVFVDDYLKTHPRLQQWRRSHNAVPGFTDAEVLTIGLLQSRLGVDSLKKTYHLVAENIPTAFPLLPSYQQWIARLHLVEFLTSHLMAALGQWGLAPTAEKVFIADSKPIPLLKPARFGRAQLLRQDGAYFGKSSMGWYFGYKLHLLIHQPTGLIIDAMLSTASLTDKVGLQMSEELPESILLCDLGYKSIEAFDILAIDNGVVRLMPSDSAPGHSLISQLRQRIETTFSQCWRQFIDRVFSRSWRGLWNTIKLKLIFYNLRCLKLISQF